MKHCQQGGHRQVRFVAMPKVIRLEIWIFGGPSRRIEVGDLMDGFQRRPVGIAEHVAFDFAKHRRDFPHAILVELLTAKDQQMVDGECCENLLPQRFAYRLAEIDAADFGAEAAAECGGYSFPLRRRSLFENVQWHGLVVTAGFHAISAPFQAAIAAGDGGDIVDKYTL
jgi:hypothetical protein